MLVELSPRATTVDDLSMLSMYTEYADSCLTDSSSADDILSLRLNDFNLSRRINQRKYSLLFLKTFGIGFESSS